jgi:hypothetical protein
MPRRRLTNRRRTSKYLGVGSSNRKNQWQARILYHGKVTHLGYYRTEEEAARVYDRWAAAGLRGWRSWLACTAAIGCSKRVATSAQRSRHGLVCAVWLADGSLCRPAATVDASATEVQLAAALSAHTLCPSPPPAGSA